MRDIYILVDYKGYFGSKQKTDWYKSGMNIDLLISLFKENDLSPRILSFTDIDFKKENYKDKLVIYTSSEDPGYYYKDFIEDIIYGLHCQGAILLPKFKFLRANNNKVFMEILRDIEDFPKLKNIDSRYYGTIEKLIDESAHLSYPIVLKTAKGALSSGVFLAKNKKELIRKAKKIAKTPSWFSTLWEYKNYVKHNRKVKLTSRFRDKFIIQNFISGLDSDWKILIYDDIIFTLNRKTRKNDFRASGSGLFSFEKELPSGMLEHAYDIYKFLGVPHLSIDIAFNGKEFFLIEFQALYFGTKTLEFAPFYFKRSNNEWEIVNEETILEEVYVKSLCKFINQSS